jgi:hypothetical protein
VGRSERDELPLRDVNHDLIAAGHPRLNFEFAAYQENQPKHWKTEGLATAADFPARSWALGQLISAKAALELLRDRAAAVAAAATLPVPLPSAAANQSLWPEFAEYECFSCHHSLADEPWRRNRRGGSSLGSPTWGSWYYPMTTAVLEHADVDRAAANEFESALRSLIKEMSRPIPDAAAVNPLAEQGIKALDDLISDLSARPASSPPFDAVGVERLTNGFNHPAAWNQVMSWDHAAQRYLALVPLNQARGRLDPRRAADQQALSDELRALLDRLRFPPGYDSPRKFDPRRRPPPK